MTKYLIDIDSERIKELLKSKDMKQYELAEEIGVTKESLNRDLRFYKDRGWGRVTRNNLELIAFHLGVSPHYLTGEIDEPIPYVGKADKKSFTEIREEGEKVTELAVDYLITQCDRDPNRYTEDQKKEMYYILLGELSEVLDYCDLGGKVEEYKCAKAGEVEIPVYSPEETSNLSFKIHQANGVEKERLEGRKMTGFCIGESKTVEHKDGNLFVNNVKPYASEKKYMIVFEADGQWYFDGATDDLVEATKIRDSNIWVVGRNSRILEVK